MEGNVDDERVLGKLLIFFNMRLYCCKCWVLLLKGRKLIDN